MSPLLRTVGPLEEKGRDLDATVERLSRRETRERWEKVKMRIIAAHGMSGWRVSSSLTKSDLEIVSHRGQMSISRAELTFSLRCNKDT